MRIACDHCPHRLGPPVKTKRIRNEVTSLPSYDILKKDAAALVWVEAVDDLELAKLRVRELATRTEGEYVIFDQRTRQIVARFNSPATS
jgi:hypothetical protein